MPHDAPPSDPGGPSRRAGAAGAACLHRCSCGGGPTSYGTDDAREALQHCDPGTDRAGWVRVLAAAKAAGLEEADALAWSATAPNFKNERDVRTAWRSIKSAGRVQACTLFHEARRNGWMPHLDGQQRQPASRPPFLVPATRTEEPRQHDTLSEQGRAVWIASASIRPGTVAAAYLKVRRCLLPHQGSHLRWLPAVTRS